MKLILSLIVLVLTVPAHAQNTRTKLDGQVVCCAECWAEADRNKVEYGTAKDLLKAKSARRLQHTIWLSGDLLPCRI